MDNLIPDLRYALRQMTRHPLFFGVLILTLALGVGANTAVFSVVNGVILRPLPYPEPEELVILWTQFPGMDLMEFPASFPEYQDYKEANRSFVFLAGFVTGAQTLTGGDAPERLDGAATTASFWDVMRVSPEVGRVFTPQEDLPGNDGVAVISHGLWTRRFGADPGVVGTEVRLDGERVQVVGVMPNDFAFPSPEVDLWRPLARDPANPGGRANHFLRIVGRLNPGLSVARASMELNTLVTRWEDDDLDQHEWNHEFHPAFLVPLHDELVGDVRASLWVLLGAVGFVLIIACANVANLLLVRGESRQRELSVRTAMGANRARVLRQLLTESLVLGFLGGVAGLFLAFAGIRLLLVLAPENLPRLEAVGLDGPVLAFSGAVTLLAALFFGVVPGIHATRTDVQATLRDEGRGSTAGRARFRLRQLLVVSEMALAMVLLVGAGLLVHSFWILNRVDPGFESEGVLTARVALPEAQYPDPSDVTGFYRDLLPRLASLPGVNAVSATRLPPLGGPPPPNDIEIENWNVEELFGNPEAAPVRNADIQTVTSGYFATLGIDLLEGRVFNQGDTDQSEVVAVVNETMAQRFFPGRSALDQRFRQPGEYEWARIVGVVADVRQLGLKEEPRAEVYFLHAQSPRVWYPVQAMTLLLRTSRDPEGLVTAVRSEVRGVDPNLALYQVQTMRRALTDSTANERFAMLLQGVFALVALLLAAVGIYGVVSYSVAQRTQEIGIRMALGAEARGVAAMVLRQGGVLAALGIGVGLIGALGLTQLMSALLFEVSTTDPLTYLAVPLTLAGVGLLASWLPARRAARTAPAEALRSE